MVSKPLRHGAIGALLDEYERAFNELIKVISLIPDNMLVVIINPETADENCKSIQSILSHVVNSGFGYATSIHNAKRAKIERPAKIFHLTMKEYIQDLNDLFAFTEKVFKEIKDEDLELMENSLLISTNWGKIYDIEQLMEHAIVHLLRHRRQITMINLDRFK